MHWQGGGIIKGWSEKRVSSWFRTNFATMPQSARSLRLSKANLRYSNDPPSPQGILYAAITTRDTSTVLSCGRCHCTRNQHGLCKLILPISRFSTSQEVPHLVHSGQAASGKQKFP